MEAAAVLGLLQGITEWFPVSSQGVVAGAYSLMFDASFDEAAGFALWLHIGTVPSVLVALRHDLYELVREFLASPKAPSHTFKFLIATTLISGMVGLPLIVVLGDISAIGGTAATGVIGGFMLVSGYLQLRRSDSRDAESKELTFTDALVVGLAQGLSVIPGLSRSGMTIAVLLSRRVDSRKALTLSFLLSIPAGLAAALYVGIESGLEFDTEAGIAAAVAFVVGLFTIKGLKKAAERMNLGWFVIAVGAAMIVGSVIVWRL